jgi:hypothetical protein
MMRRLSSCVAGLVVAALLLAPGAAAQAPSPFTVVSESAVYDPATGLVTFTLTFNRPPDFRTEDELGRRADSFQYYILGDLSLPYPAYYDSLVRGDEIDLTLGLLPIRNAVPPSTDPAAHGWGAVRGLVPFRLSGNVLTFSAPLTVLSDHSLDGHFAYELLLTQYGALTDFLRSESTVRPSRPTSKEQCKRGGWRSFPQFKNQGNCVSFVATTGKGP